MIKKALKIIGLATGLGVGYLVTRDAPKEVVKDCEIYRGYTNRSTEATEFVFDSLPLETRTRAPKFSVTGEDSLKNTLESDNKYCFEIKIPPAYSLREPRIASIEPEPKFSNRRSSN